LPFERRFVIGGECEALWRRAIERNMQAELAKRTLVVRDQWRKAARIPISERSKWTRTQDYQDYLEDVRGAMQEDQGIDTVDDDRDPERLHVICPPRPKNLRQQIIRDVAVKHGVTERMVKRCWEEYRRFERQE